MPVEFHDYSIKVKGALNSGVEKGLIAAAGEITSQAIRNSRRKTGQLAGSWSFNVEDKTATIGSPLQNAIWEEFGTGEYAESGGRKGGWVYRDAEGNFHFTRGKRPNRTLQRAFESKKNTAIMLIKKAIQEAVGK